MKTGAAKLQWARGEARSAPLCKLVSSKRRVRAAQGAHARPKPTSRVYLTKCIEVVGILQKRGLRTEGDGWRGTRWVAKYTEQVAKYRDCWISTEMGSVQREMGD
jgi:hypothetical protein